MFSKYPSSVPSYNSFRVKVPQGTLDETDKCYEITAPKWLWRYMLGQMSQLSEVNVWQSEINDIRTSENAVDAYNTLQIEECQNCVDMTVSINQIGLVFAFVAGDMPTGAVPCVGQTLTIDTHPDLVQTAKDESWVGFLPDDGINPDRYTLPDLRNKMVYGTASGGGQATLRDIGGSETVTLDASEIPDLDISVGLTDVAGTGTARSARGAGTRAYEQPGAIYENGGLPHDNMPPYMRLIWCMFVEEVEYQNTYDYSVTASDCVLFENNDGQITEIVDIKQCASDVIDDEKRIDPDDNLALEGDIDCIYGGACKVATFVRDEVVSFLEQVDAGVDEISAFISKFPFSNAKFAAEMFKAVASLTLSSAIATLNDPDTLQDLCCDLWCEVMVSDDPKVLDAATIDRWRGKYAIDPLVGINALTTIGVGILSVGYTKLARIFSLGFDECNDDWLLCDCFDRITLNIDGDDSSYQSSSGNLLNTVTYVVSVTGTYDYGSGKDDGFFTWTNANPSNKIRTPDSSTNSGIVLRYPDGSTQTLPELYTPDEYSPDGYSFKLTVFFTGDIDGKVQDTPVSDNSGQIKLDFVRVT